MHSTPERWERMAERFKYFNMSVTKWNASISGTNNIPLGNEKVSSSTTDSKVLTGIQNPITLNYNDNKLGNNLINGNRIYLKFYLTVPGSQAAGNYVNLLNFKAVPNGVIP